MVKQYDLVIVGGGVAGLSLACHIIASPLRELSILILENRPNSMVSRSMAFWANHPTPFDGIVLAAWKHMRVANERGEHVSSLRDYRCKLIRGADFYQHAREQFAIRGGVDFVQATAEKIEDTPEGVRVFAGGREYAGRFAFDSCLRWAAIAPDARHTLLRQQICAWSVKTPKPVFDPRVATLFDFRTPQHSEMRFFQLLPLSEQQAFVECVAVDGATRASADFEGLLRQYLSLTLHVNDFEIASTSGGSVVLTDQAFERRVGRHVMNIGGLGGRIKPSAGYGFMRIQRDSAAIVESLRQHGHPFDVPADPPFYRLADAVMLDLMRHESAARATQKSARMNDLFIGLFSHNSADRVFHFLDQNASLEDIRAIVDALPTGQILKTALGKVLG